MMPIRWLRQAQSASGALKRYRQYNDRPLSGQPKIQQGVSIKILMVINAKKPKHVQRDAMKCLDGRGRESMVYVLSIRILICCTYQGCTDEVRIAVPVVYRMSIYFYSVCSFCCSSAGIETVKVSLRTNYLRKKRERKRSEAMVSNIVSWRFTMYARSV